jgi:glycogen debranching enzyme
MPSLHNSNLREIAESSLRANIIPTAQGTLCVAGAHQFKTLWTRDFCYAVPGLLALGLDDLVRRQLRVILSFMRTDGLLPRGLDVTSPKVRVVNALMGNPLKDFLSYSQPLRPEYIGEHGTVAFDSNMLWLYSSTLSELEEDVPVKKLLSLYERNPDGLYDQPKYSEWMDSLKRKGPRLLFHLQMWRTLRALGIEHDSLSRVIKARWFADENRWATETTDALLLAIELGFGETQALVEEVRGRPVGVPSLPQPVNEVSLTARAVGLRRYHDGFAWAWLSAETARVMRAYDAEFADGILAELEALCVNEGAVPEIYEAGTDKAVRLKFYRSEMPFSWGAAKILEALAE